MVAMMQSIALLMVGFVLLIKGADFFVEGSSSVARALQWGRACRNLLSV